MDFRVIGVASLLLCFSCADNLSKLRATGTGDISNPKAPRRAADSELVRACGTNSVSTAGATQLARRPYLQQLGATQTRVLFNSLDEAAVTIDVTRPDGVLVTSRDAVFQGDPGRTIEIDKLEPNTIYCYSLRGLTGRVGFRTAPAVASPAPIRFVAFGDSGTGDWYQKKVYEQILDVPFDFVLHAGDLAYNAGTSTEIETRFFGVYGRMLSQFPVFPAIGNHDDATDNGAAYLRAFALPENGSPNAPERYYSVDWGDAHFVSLDTENIDDEQAQWLDADLASTKRRWTIVLSHRPPYSSGHHGPNSAFQKKFVPILERHRVPLVISGHEHNYERIKPRNGVNYVVSGGGAKTRPFQATAQTAYGEDVLHFVFVEIDGPTLLLHAIDGTGHEFDSVKISKG